MSLSFEHEPFQLERLTVSILEFEPRDTWASVLWTRSTGHIDIKFLGIPGWGPVVGDMAHWASDLSFPSQQSTHEADPQRQAEGVGILADVIVPHKKINSHIL
ncbi:uncharacterized protein CIMG_11351 [Coccidioides immitis RS]|uniref:Uncharacterized protein n=3 Tax=Coccidioides immitis TaxID=5501 RepID=A0A0D8JVN2_COCIM|nr:uncharacterized protein CIMG_11351 [Coccidioides immitis RS]KJF61001.1 hypothetical protein CIMG_11351 [Coccidioides immitis RS]KMP04753.1 hypothetical protein CIRG_04434 [Coccidioides immitis RMSCC 2394]KMU89077.1 hypothetical protein CIHG_06879 [Coccidioides immitis H538.4]